MTYWTALGSVVGPMTCVGVHDDTGLLYMRRRHYEARLGRFLSRDRILPLNRYIYASQSPLVLADPDGREPIRIDDYFDVPAIDRNGLGGEVAFQRILRVS